METGGPEEKAGVLARLEKRISAVLTRRNQVVLFLATLVLAALSIYDAATERFPRPVSVAIYVGAACCFFSSVALWVRAGRLLVRVVLTPFSQRHEALLRPMQDYRLRTVLMTLPGLGINGLFAGFNAWLGISRHSAWHGSLAAYYMLLCAMRMAAVIYGRSIYRAGPDRSRPERELRVYGSCGASLAGMSLALAGAVIMLAHGAAGKSYPGVQIYAVAAYTFYKLAMAVRNMVRAHRERSLVTITLRNIGLADALVSILYLQTAMLNAFGTAEPELADWMNRLTGIAVCMAVLLLGLYMCYDARRRKGKGDGNS